MIRKNQRYFNWIHRLTDLLIMYVSYLGAVGLWFFVFEHDRGNIAIKFALRDPLPLLIVFFGVVIVFQYAGLYDSFRLYTASSELLKLLKAFALCFCAAIGFLFVLKVQDFSRGTVVVFGLLAYILLALKRILLRKLLYYIREHGYNKKYVLIVGDGYSAEKYADIIRGNPYFGLHIIGYVGEEKNNSLGVCLGNYADINSILERFNPDEVVIALEQYESDRTDTVVMACEEIGIRANIIPIYNDILSDCASIDVLDGVKLINIRAIPLDINFNKALKRATDLILSIFAIIILSPLMVFIAAAIKISSPGPVFFKQKRVGKDRKDFVMLKFRSMTVNDSSDTAWSTVSDNRVTRVGAFIRKFSIDELPQFFNVLRGDMSVIGPRPELPYFVERYKNEIPRYMVKHQVRPGITGWAQVNGYRGDTSIEKRIEHDIWYIENWSMALDIKIIFMTVFGGMINNEKNIRKFAARELSVK